MKKVLVTGGAGFIGYHLSKHLISRGVDVTLVDNLFRGKMDYLFSDLLKESNLKFVNLDLTNPTSFKRLDCAYDYVYHLAAINGTEYFYKMPDAVLRTNILTAINVLDWFTKSNCGKILFTSSSETYAGTMTRFGLPIPTPEDVPLCICDVFNPRWSYAGSKIIGELLFINYARMHNLDMSIVRYHNVYGPRMGYSHVIPNFLLRIYDGIKPFPIYGSTQRAFCYVDDAVKATELVMTNKNCSGKILNIGNNLEEITTIDLAKLMFEILNYHAEISVGPEPEGSVGRRCPNIDKLTELTGYCPEVPIRTGLSLTHDYYYANFKNGVCKPE